MGIENDLAQTAHIHANGELLRQYVGMSQRFSTRASKVESIFKIKHSERGLPSCGVSATFGSIGCEYLRSVARWIATASISFQTGCGSIRAKQPPRQSQLLFYSFCAFVLNGPFSVGGILCTTNFRLTGKSK
jgi:hypothetical protein